MPNDDAFSSVTSITSNPDLGDGVTKWASGLAIDRVVRELRLAGLGDAIDAKFSPEQLQALRDSATNASFEERSYRIAMGHALHECLERLIKEPRGSVTPESLVRGADRPPKLKRLLAVYKSTSDADLQDITNCLAAFERFTKAGLYAFLGTELRVVNKALAYQGRLDALALDVKRGEMAVMDFKLKPKAVGYEAAMQLAAYAGALNEVLGAGAVTEAYILQFVVSGGSPGAHVALKRVADLDLAFDAFIARNLLHHASGEVAERRRQLQLDGNKRSTAVKPEAPISALSFDAGFLREVGRW